MVDVANEPPTSQITEQSVVDLCHWLSDHTEHTEAQLYRLKNEKHYLGLIELANIYWLIGHLVKRLKDRNLWQCLPIELSHYLNKIDDMYMQRSIALRQEAIDVCTLLKPITNQIVLLKGATTLFNGLANPISTRYMTDLDILIPNDKLDSCLNRLQESGYSFDHSDLSIQSKDFHHAAPAIRHNGPCYVELHRRPLVNSLKHILDADQALASAIPLLLRQDLTAYQMHPTQQIIHAIAHSELQDYGYEEWHLDLRQLLHFYLLATRFGSKICWKSVEQRFTQTGYQPVLTAMIYKANQLFGMPIPIDLSNVEAEHLHYVRCLHAFCQTKVQNSKLDYFKKIMRGYSRDTITNLYGNNGQFPVLVGRLKHLHRHLKLFFKH